MPRQRGDLRLNNCLEGIELALDVLDDHGGRAAARAILEQTLSDCPRDEEPESDNPKPWIQVR